MDMKHCKRGDQLLLRNGNVATLYDVVLPEFDAIYGVIYPYDLLYNESVYSVTKDGLVYTDALNPMDVIGFATKADDVIFNEAINNALIDKVLEQIKADVINGDVTAIEELLKQVPIEILKSYLPEE
jgi:hypothetical protein